MDRGLQIDRRPARIALLLVVAALFMRMLIPAGWMPAAEGGAIITLCTGAGAEQAWIDDEGKLHKGAKPGEGQADHPCAFAGFAAVLDLPSTAAALALLPPLATGSPALAAATVAIGRGLAAPPPPSTGPPSRL